MIHRSSDLTVLASSERYSGSFIVPDDAVNSGLIVEGTLVQVRNHSIEDSSRRRLRFVALVVELSFAKQRTFNAVGEEEVNQHEAKKIERRGNYLNIYDKIAVQDPLQLSSDQVLEFLGGAALPPNYYDAGRAALHPSTPNRFEFWGESSKLRSNDYKAGDKIRLRTKNHSIFIDMSAGISELSKGFAGEDVLGGWDSKVQAMKHRDSDDTKPLPSASIQGVDEDEWD